MKLFTVKLDDSGAILLFAEGHFIASPRDGQALIAAMHGYNAAHDKRNTRAARQVELLSRTEQERLIADWLQRNTPTRAPQTPQLALSIEQL